MGYIIMAKYGREAAEEVDTAKTLKDAIYLVGEYTMAFGHGWRIWRKRGKID